MTGRRLSFPDGFLWGGATSSHQCEGFNTNNDFWVWEHNPGHVVDKTISGAACDWWNRAEEDFDRAAALGLNTLRISLEWSRLEPERGRWTSKAVDRYREMLQAMIDRGLTPLVTLHHFSNPRWLAQRGGWELPEVVDLFTDYTRRAVEAFQDLCGFWGTINEPNVYAAMAYSLGRWSPGKQSPHASAEVLRHMARAHAAAYHAVKRLQPDSRVGLVQHVALFHPVNPGSFFNRLAARVRSDIINWRAMEAVEEGRFRFPLGLGLVHPEMVGTNDFLGLNYYGRHLLKFKPTAPGVLFAEEAPADPKVAWPAPWTDREIYPEGLYRWAVDVHRRFGKPIYITENGLADATDEARPAYILTHLAALHRAIRDGADVRGYYYWSLVDNYEWVEGWTTRFGLIGLDPETQERTIRPSAEMFARIARENAITEEVVAQYAPELVKEFWPEPAACQLGNA